MQQHSARRELIVFLLGLLLITGISCLRGLGPLANFAGIVVTIWALIGIARRLVKRESPKIILGKVGVWLVAFLCIYIVHHEYAVGARDEANSVLNEVNQFRNKNGEYPNSLDALKVDRAAMSRNHVIYGLYSDGPHLDYWGTFAAFSSYNYDFKTKEWSYDPG